MSLWNVRVWSKGLVVVSMALALGGCFKNPGNPTMPTFNIAIPIMPIYDYATLVDSYLHATGACHGNTDILFTYSSTLTSTTSVDGVCKNDQVDVKLPIQFGNDAQTFNVQVVARLRTNSAPPVTVVVNFSPPVPLTPGYEITSGGGFSSSGTAQIVQTLGEVTTPVGDIQAVYTAPGMALHTGVQGMNNP